ncbi:MAG: excinuclease ABC subunit A, partial [Pedobacter sp.]
EGEGFVMVELLFLPSVYTPCPTCGGTRYNPQTLDVKYAGKNIAEVLNMTVDAAWSFFAKETALANGLDIVRQVGLGYLKLGQPATELSGGEAQRIKLATELQRTQHGNTLYILDEPTTGLHPSDVDKLMIQLGKLVDQGNTIIVVEHDMSVIAASDWVIEIGPGAGNKGGKIVAAAVPPDFVKSKESTTAPYLRSFIDPKV